MSITVHPFTTQVSQAQLDDLDHRLADVRWPEHVEGLGWSRGVPVPYLQDLVKHWSTGYDWRAQERRLDEAPQFVTEIQGQRVHFVHARSPEPKARPLLLLHGWPGSFTEFLDLLGPLTDPRGHGGDPDMAFHVVAPSLPGFAWSSPLREAGWTTTRMAEVLAELMDGLGYERYGVHGGDLGAIVGPDVGRVAPDRVIGVHVNAASVGFIPLRPVSEKERASLTPLEVTRLERIGRFMSEDNAYHLIQGTRPHTLSYGLADSPVAQLAWIVEKFQEWTGSEHQLPEDAVDRDRILTNVMLYWLTNTAASSAYSYYEGMHGGAWPTDSGVPTGVAVFADDVSIRRFAEESNTIVHWSDFDTGGHFAAWETPDLLVADLRAFFGSLG